MNKNFKEYLLSVTNSSDCKELEIIQTLWSGYGKISRYQLKNASFNTVVVKCISLNKWIDHPRGWDTDYSHKRKVRSMKNVVKLDNYFSPGQLETKMDEFVRYYNYERYHESINNVTPADVYYGKAEKKLITRQKTKQITLKARKKLNQKK